MRYGYVMPREYKNHSPAMRLLERSEQVMRVQGRVLKQMFADTEHEQREVKGIVISSDTNPKGFVRDTMARIAKSKARFADIDLMLHIFFCRHYDNFEIFLEE